MKGPWADPLRFVRTLAQGGRFLFIDFPPRSVPRYGYCKPPHPVLYRQFARERAAYRERLERLLDHGDAMRAIPAEGRPDGGEPYWLNGNLPGLDAASLYGLLASRAPRRYLEIGSGHSTRFARRAIRDQGLPTSIVSIDPAPRASVEGLVDTWIRRRLEDVPIEELEALVSAGDVLFFDGSHRCLTNSDVTVFFLDLVPRLPEGVLVQVHDVCLPYDYPPEWSGRHYSEQYVLAAYWLGGGAGARLILPNAFVSGERDLAGILNPLWKSPGLERVERRGSSFWFETGPPPRDWKPVGV